MQQYVSATVVRDDESIALRDIKPLDAAGHLQQIELMLFGLSDAAFQDVRRVILAAQRSGPQKRCAEPFRHRYDESPARQGESPTQDSIRDAASKSNFNQVVDEQL